MEQATETSKQGSEKSVTAKSSLRGILSSVTEKTAADEGLEFVYELPSSKSIKSIRDPIRVTLSGIKKEASSYGTDLYQQLSGARPWIYEKFKLFKYRVLLTIPVDLRLIKPTLIDGLVWGTLCSIGNSIGQMLGCCGLPSAVLELMFTKFMAVLLAEILIPIAFYWKVHKKPLRNAQFKVLMLSFLMGFLTGYSFPEQETMELISFPSISGFLQSLMMVFTTQMLSNPHPRRAMYIAAMLGPGTAISIALAIYMDEIYSRFFIWSLVLWMTVTIINIQISVAAAKDNNAAEGLVILMIGILSGQTLDLLFVHFMSQLEKPEVETAPVTYGYM